MAAGSCRTRGFGEDVDNAMELVPKTITRPVSRLGATAQNALEVARFGGLTTDEQPSPFEVAAEHRVYRLRHYYPGGPDRPPVLLVPPMMLAADVYDVARATSAVSILDEHGADPWVVDFGAPERQAGGLERTLADHVVAISDAVDHVRKATGRDVHLGGYSQGGMFCYQTAAYRRNEGLASLITFGSPVDTRRRNAVRDPRVRRIRALPDCSPTAYSVTSGCRPGLAGPASRCWSRSSRRATGSSSSSSSTIARHCSRARVSAGSSRPTVGSPGRGRRWPTSCSSSSRTTACSKAGLWSMAGS